MAQTDEEKWLQYAEEYSAPLEDWQKVPVIGKEEDINETMSVPGVIYSADPTLTTNAKPQNFVQLHLGTLFHRINSMEDGVAQARDEANAAAERADNSRELIESNESTRQQNEETRQQNETTRQSQESTRQSQEQARQTAEATRQQTFVTNEQARQSAFQNSEQTRQSTFEANEAQRQQDFEDAEADRMAAIMLTEFFVDPQTMHLMVVQPKNDVTDYNIDNGHLMVTFQYDDGL